MNKDFPDGATLVLGGSGGIGSGVAIEFARAGSAVALCYRAKREVAEQTAESIRSHGVEASLHGLDVRDPSQVDATLERVMAHHGRIHSMVWAAGPLVSQLDIAALTLEQYRNAFDVEVFGFFNVTRALIPHFRAHGGGAFVHLGSAGHDWWPPKDALSVAPKAANESLVRGIAKEEGRHEIRANSILVGVIDAGMFHQLREQGQFSPEWEAETRKLLALKRWGTAEDIGHAAVFLASRRARYVTGQTISVSGGFGV